MSMDVQNKINKIRVLFHELGFLGLCSVFYLNCNLEKITKDFFARDTMFK